MQKLKDFLVVDPDTHEVLAEHVIFIGKKNRDKNYAKVFLAFLDSIVENDRIAGKSIRLLFYMVNRMKYDSLEIEIIPRIAIRDLKISKITFYKWINDLIEFEIIEKVDTYTYRLKPYTFSRGDTKKAISNKSKKAV